MRSKTSNSTSEAGSRERVDPPGGDNPCVSDEYDYYQDVSGVQPWIPPEGYENPVPPARGDAVPAGHKRSLLAGLRSRRADAGDATSTLRWLIIIVVIGLFVWFSVVPWIEEQVDRGSGLLEDIEKTIDDARESVEQGGANTDEGAAAGDSPPEADGKSNLPGRYASLKYSVLSNETEWANKQSIDSPYDGSVWGVSRANSDGASYIMLSHYTFVPPITTAAERQTFADSVVGSLGAKSGTTPKRSTITVDGRDGYEYRFVKSSGSKAIVTYFLGDKHSYRFDCDAAEGDDEFYTSCERAQQSLSFRR